MTPPAIPYARATPLIGNLLAFRNKRLDLFMNTSRACGAIGYFQVGPRRVLLLNSAALVRAVLVDHDHHFARMKSLRAFLWPLLGNGLLNSEQELHTQQRKLIAPILAHRKIITYADFIAEYTEQFCKEWKDGAEIDIAQDMIRLTMTIISNILFGVDIRDKTDAMHHHFTVATEYANNGINSLFHLPIPWIDRPFSRAIAHLNTSIEDIIAQRIASGAQRDDLLDVLIRQAHTSTMPISTKQIRDELVNLLFAGHETTASALTWTWHVLIQHPDVYRRAQQEVARVLQGRTPTHADLVHLPYLLQVLKESLRLYPPVYVIGRQSIAQVSLQNYVIPKHTPIAISPYVLHRNPEYYPNPDVFMPERFAADHELHIPRYAYLPFGAGGRSCLGGHLAMMEAHIILASILQRASFQARPQQRIQPKTTITLKPKDGLSVSVHRHP